MSDEFGTAVNRRQLLAGALAGGAAYALPGSKAFAASGGGTSAGQPDAPPAASYTFFSDPGLNFQVLFALGAAGYGASEVGEVLAIFDRINTRGVGYNVVYDEFLNAGKTLRALGDKARDQGLSESARGAYLRSAMYFDQALFYVLATNTPTRKHEGDVYKQMEGSWQLAAQESSPSFEQVKIPYGKTTLPGWFLPADGAGSRSKRPTIILNNGSDAQNIDMWVYGGAAAIERGWNALIFEGPGQGSNLFLRSMPFRYDWEKVITPVVNFLRKRSEVDKRRIALAGQSFGGYLVARAAAFEHRLAAVIADPGVYDAFISWQKGLPSEMLTMLDAGKKQEFNAFWSDALQAMSPGQKFNVAKRTEIYGSGTFFDQMTLAKKFTMSEKMFQRINSPMAVLSPEDEQFFAGQPQQVYDWLKTKRKELVKFTVAEGAQFHCEPMAPQLRNERVYDWLEKNLQPTS